MARELHLLKTTFSSGELDPDLAARSDIKHYYNGAETMANVNPKPKSGFERREGLEFIADVTAAIGDGSARWFNFKYDPETTYGLLFLDTVIKVFKNRALVHTITSTPWEDADIATGISFVQEADTLIVLCKDVAPYSIVRNSDTSWTVAAISFDTLPQYDYTPGTDDRSDSSTPDATCTPSAVTGTNINLTLSGGTYAWVTGDIGKFVFMNGGVARITKRSSALIAKAKVLVDFYDTDGNAAGDWTLDAAAIQPSATSGNIKIDASGDIFSTDDVGQKIVAGGGLIRITQYNSDTQVLGIAEIPLASTDPIASGQWSLRTGFEDAWNATNGYPTHGTFHQGRLVLAGGPRLAAWASRVGQFYDFALGSGLDADPCEIDINSGGEVVGVASLGKKLFIFTNGAEFVDENKPITPNNFAPEATTKYGALKNVDIVELDGENIFIDNSGSAIYQYYNSNEKQNFTGDDITLLSPHLIGTPTSLAKKEPESSEEPARLFLTNADGTARQCHAVTGQEFLAWSRITSDASAFFILAGVDDTDVYFLVKRTINATTKYFVESFNADHYLDCSVRVTAGLPDDALVAAHLPNEEVTVMADDVDMGEYDLDGSGEATLERDAEDYYEIGFNFVPTVVTMPVEPELKEGTRLGKKKRISEVTFELSETNGLTVNGRDINFRELDAPLDDPIPLFTGRKRVRGLLGWSLKAQITITQPRPGSMTVLAMSAKVSV